MTEPSLPVRLIKQYRTYSDGIIAAKREDGTLEGPPLPNEPETTEDAIATRARSARVRALGERA